MRINIAKIAIIVFWLLMSGWLIRYEAFPEKFSEALSGYRALLQNGPLILDSWMRIECQGAPVGYSHTWVDVALEHENAAYTVKNQTFLNFRIMGQEQLVGVTADARLDDQYGLQMFSAVMSSSLYATRIEGKRSKKGFFDVMIKTPGAEKHFELEIPEDVVFYSPMIEMAMGRLAPGQSLRLKTIDPLSLSIADAVVEAVRREDLVCDGQTHATTLLNILYQGLTVKAWIDDQGRILREETPFGWTMCASTPREVFSRRRQGGDDLLASLAVPLHGQLSNPRGCKRLMVRLNGNLPDLDGLTSPRQLVVERLENAVVLELAAQEKPADIIPFGRPMPPELSPFLSASAAIQSADPEMVKQAKTITAGSADCFQAAQAINEWVYRNIVKKPTISLPSALDILQQREGDCNEHTYLFVALARAAGLPAQINVGLVFAEVDGRPGAFYYHAWPSVFVGQWVDLDPTFGTPLVDATYIRLTAGEIGNQIKLFSVLGRLSVDLVWQK